MKRHGFILINYLIEMNVTFNNSNTGSWKLVSHVGKNENKLGLFIFV